MSGTSSENPASDQRRPLVRNQRNWIHQAPAATRNANKMRPARVSGVVCSPHVGTTPMLGLSKLLFRRSTMGKYFLAWLLGVPGIVLLLVYLFFS